MRLPASPRLRWLPRALNNAATAALIAVGGTNTGKDLVDDACAKKAAAELTRD